MKRISTFLSVFLLCLLSGLKAQDFMGYSTSNYSGITGAFLNPANIVDSRFKFDAELVGLDFNFSNNYIGVKKSGIQHTSAMFKDNNVQQDYLVERMNSDKKSVFLSANLHMPSFMVTLNKKNAIGFTWRVRNYLNVDGVEPNLAHQLWTGVLDSTQYKQTLENKHLSVQYMSWAEYGVVFAHVFKNDGDHFLKAGVTVKLLQGIAAAYFNINDLHYNFSNKDTLSSFNSEVNYGHSNNLQPFAAHPSYNFAQAGVGGDLGVVYEYRPDHDKYKYDMDGETNLDMRWKNKYKFKASFSVLDIGGIKYAKGPYSRDFNANVNLWNIHHVMDSAKNTPITTFDDTLKKKFAMNQTDNSFYMSLPTSFTGQVDYNIWKDFYVAGMGYWALQMPNSAHHIHEVSNVAIVPRWDHKWFGVFFPVSYNSYKNFNYGINLRLGPLILGTNALNSYYGKSDVYGTEFHVLLKIPIPYGPIKDRDKDKISDKKDKCPDTPGVWEFMGCPDRDGDHVQDSEDQCPDEPGLVQFHGCPDRDGDGIIDKLDACPDDAGLPQFNGCPDKDGDGIIDKEDECPDQPGLAAFHGCPDRDGDGVPDKVDLCPDKPGPVDNEGCPEVKLILLDPSFNALKNVRQAKDGSFTFDNLPADENVIFRLEGDDTDKLTEVRVVVNGVSKKAVRGADRYFRFLIIKPDQNKLKPMNEKDVPIKLTKEEAQILKKAFSNLEFETAKDVIKPESFASLDELAELLKKKPEWKLKLSGHTDNQGKKEDNMKLSEKRAKSVAKYLSGKGVDEKRFKVEWFGQTKPIAPNTTPQGRQKNRRVEMLIID